MNDRTFINLRKKIHHLKMMGTDNLIEGPILDQISFRIKNLPGTEKLSYCQPQDITKEIGEIMSLMKSIEKTDNFQNDVVHYEKTKMAPKRKLAKNDQELLKLSNKQKDLNLKFSMSFLANSNKNNCKLKKYEILKLAHDLCEKKEINESLMVLRYIK